MKKEYKEAFSEVDKIFDLMPLDLLSKIAVFCSDVANVVRLGDAKTAEEVIDMLKEVEA